MPALREEEASGQLRLRARSSRRANPNERPVPISCGSDWSGRWVQFGYALRMSADLARKLGKLGEASPSPKAIETVLDTGGIGRLRHLPVLDDRDVRFGLPFDRCRGLVDRSGQRLRLDPRSPPARTSSASALRAASGCPHAWSGSARPPCRSPFAAPIIAPISVERPGFR